MTKFTHFNEQGHAHMVDISHKKDTIRTAAAKSSVIVNKTIYEEIENKTNKKGDVLAVAQIAGIMGAKQTSSIIPMCHPLPLTQINITFGWVVDYKLDKYELSIKAEVKTKGPTGVEMEALTAVSIAALTIYDMCKAADKNIIIGPTMLIKKTGGKSGDFFRK